VENNNSLSIHRTRNRFPVTEDGEDTGWAEQFLAAFDRIIDER
jgi:hypothetical protein